MVFSFRKFANLFESYKFIFLFFLLGFLHCTKIDHAYFLNGLDKPLPEVTDLNVNRGLSGITLTWKSPANIDFNIFNKVLILKSTSAILDFPKPWRNYPVSTTMGASRVVYNAAASTFTDTEVIENVVYFYKIFVSDTYLYYNDGIQTRVDEYMPPLADSDGDGLIEIHNFTKLHNIRYNLAGTSYKTSATQTTGNSNGCPPVVNGSGGCNGYELTQDFNFDKDGDGTTWIDDSTNGCTLDAGDNASPHFIVANGGWEPIGSYNAAFNAIFEGNGHTITGLAISRNQNTIGMFGFTGANAKIRNIGLNNNLIDCTRVSGTNYIGGLVGSNDGNITASYATGSVSGGDGIDYVGGLVGYQNIGSITASYATGSVSGGDGIDYVGGLVGRQNIGSITASYATGSVDGGDGTDYVGGLVGYQNTGSITASYATGSVSGGDGIDYVGSLMSRQNSGSITASYGFGTIVNEETPNSLGAPPTGVSSAINLTSMTSISIIDPADNTMMMMITTTIGALWNDATKNTKDAWDFGTRNQIPALKYADYDGTGTTGTTYYCDSVPPPTTGTPIPIPNCGTLIIGQR